MELNGITSSLTTSYDYQKYAVKAAKAEENVDNSSSINTQAATYESSANSKTSETETNSKTQNTELINKLKSDLEARTNQLQDIVNKMLSKQGKTYNTANGLKSLYESLEVDEATVAQAKADIAEDGYFGVTQTSERIFDFAMALTGGDASSMEKMKEAFEKGFKQATDAWGDELPDICQDTYAAVLQKFEDYANSLSTEE